ncbi:MAG: transposase [Okeania sp. SIO3B5]|nr:transposase [Okeania sp. SIO3B5]
MSLNVRTFECTECDFTADRDFNAAVNQENYVHK